MNSNTSTVQLTYNANGSFDDNKEVKISIKDRFNDLYDSNGESRIQLKVKLADYR